MTPPALASQWADELAAHAPSLKVLVYDGWAKVGVPITLAQLAEEQSKPKAVKSGATKVKSKAPSRSKPASRSTSQRPRRAAATTRGKGKAVDDDVEMDDAEDGPMPVEVSAPELLDWCSYVNTFDVVITTYTVLRSDLNVARATPIRPRREDVVYQNVGRPRSPLVMCEWMRVIMDEVQMVGGGKTELRHFPV